MAGTSFEHLLQPSGPPMPALNLSSFLSHSNHICTFYVCMLDSSLYLLSYSSSPLKYFDCFKCFENSKPFYAFLQGTSAPLVKRRWTLACPLHARTMALATWMACISPAAAAQASQGLRVPSWWTSAPSVRVLMACAVAWAPATSASAIQVGPPCRQPSWS